LALSIWAAALGLAAILVGTLCDERKATLGELHEAYVGVIEVIAQYLKGADQRAKTLTGRAAQLSQSVAAEMGLDSQETDDIRVGVLLSDLGDIEVTTKLLNRAVNAIEAHPGKTDKYTFLGTDLADSLGGVLTRAASLMLNQDDTIRECLAGAGESATPDIPVGAKIIRAVRQYLTLTTDDAGGTRMSSAAAIQELREDSLGGYDSHVIAAIERVVQRSAAAQARSGQRQEPALQAR
jgi:response regulator RpfG family c-di-GMP phosphodiesterase